MDAKYYKKHIKKPVLEKIRKCELPGCEVTFAPNRADQRYCCSKHNTKHWRMIHPRIYGNKGRHSTAKAGEICGYDRMRRDKPELWLKYMRNNPLYAESLGMININSLGI